MTQDGKVSCPTCGLTIYVAQVDADFVHTCVRVKLT